ncbi:hypothetical protein BU26DRAFT_557963 [Trematosphaeria pertusa]|uniref:Uncharacterized protein n=1 Tax=Trematosphaeria pertusa TaxID=390896 RepID=A0A6A6J2E7_9PLEO|nr:uncharacterized protein BU26DRAFT_557963 [Trematosphaeria pertusa]KAF2256517.1 hypothetical protein BU26DRAFT_557963 [Trematosphaeria pertusa]
MISNDDIPPPPQGWMPIDTTRAPPAHGMRPVWPITPPWTHPAPLSFARWMAIERRKAAARLDDFLWQRAPFGEGEYEQFMVLADALERIPDERDRAWFIWNRGRAGRQHPYNLGWNPNLGY